jgi:aromatic-L-amino-acid decarboxylase
VDDLTATGRVYLTHTRLGGRIWMRIAVGNILTMEQHLAEVWKLLRDALDRQREPRNFTSP